MKEISISAAIVLWVIAYGLLAVAAGIFLWGDGRWAYLCGTAACVTTGLAAVVQIHGFCARLCRLIRAATGYAPDGEDGEGLRLVP